VKNFNIFTQTSKLYIHTYVHKPVVERQANAIIKENTNMCIGNDTKAAARRSQNCIRKTKNTKNWWKIL